MMQTSHFPTGYLWRAALFFLAACRAPDAFAQSAAVSGPADATQLVWRKKAPDGTDLGVDRNVAIDRKNVGQGNDRAAINGNGTLSKKRGQSDVAMFKGDLLYTAELDSSVRKKISYVTFTLSGPVSTSPELGTLVDIDGAVLGLWAPDRGGMAEIVILDTRKDGTKQWMGTGFRVSIDHGTQRTHGAILSVKLDHENHIWGLYAGDVVLDDFIPLAAGESRPVVNARGGKSNVTIVQGLTVGSSPRVRASRFVPSHNGKIDLAKAYADGHSMVRKDNQSSSPPKQ